MDDGQLGEALNQDGLPIPVLELRRACMRASCAIVWRAHGSFGQDDVASEAVLALVRSPAFRSMTDTSERSVRAFVGRTVFRAYIRLYRREEKGRRAEEGYIRLLPDAAPPSVISSIAVFSILKRLSEELPDCPRLLVQKIVYGDSYEELAATWRKTAGALRVQVHRCLKRAFRLAA